MATTATTIATEPTMPSHVAQMRWRSECRSRPVIGARIDPYYLLTQLPGESEAEFVMLRSFVPFGNDDNQQLTAFMVARMDPGHYGELVSYSMPRQNRPDGPAIVADAIISARVIMKHG